jgi:outer membrane PBP1 activator LpoA protein
MQWHDAALPRSTAIVLLVLAVALVGCGAAPERHEPSAAPPTAERAARLAAQGDHAAAARAYDDLAARDPARAAQALSAATREWLAAGSAAGAAGSWARLIELDPEAAATQPALALLGAEVELANGQPARALALLDRLPRTLEVDTAAAAALTRGRAEFALGHLGAGIAAFEARAKLLPPEEAAANTRLLWDGLSRAARNGADLRPSAGAQATTTGWLALAAITVRAEHSPYKLPRELESWRSRYPTHPANGPLLRTMLDEIGTRLEAPPQVALLLPLSGRTAAAAEALREGFLAAYYQHDAAGRPKVEIYDVRSDPVGAYQRALADGALAVVGPLTKEDVQAVAAVASPGVTTLALNVLPEGTSPSPRFYQFALAPEDEARQVAERLLAENRRVGAALVPTGEWGTRVLAAFQAALVAGGGTLATSRSYAPGIQDFSETITDILGFPASRERQREVVAATGVSFSFVPRRRSDLQFIFALGQPSAGRQIRSQLKYYYATDLPMYSISDMYEPNKLANQDLDGLLFPDMPWMLSSDPAIGELREAIDAASAAPARHPSRLYAMGFDSYRLIGELKNGGGLAAPVGGLTGRLSADGFGRIHRSLDWAQIRADGSAQPLPSTAR